MRQLGTCLRLEYVIGGQVPVINGITSDWLSTRGREPGGSALWTPRSPPRVHYGGGWAPDHAVQKIHGAFQSKQPTRDREVYFR